MFCYTGGFSLAAAALGKAREVLGFDSSQRAVAQARANAERNGVGNVRFESGDAFETLHALKTAGEQFDGLVLDPPKFARSRSGVEDALRAYARLNRLADRGARAGRDPGHVQLLGPREPRRLFLHAGRRGPAERARHPGPRAAWCGGRSSRIGHLSGDRIFEVFYLPGAVGSKLFRQAPRPLVKGADPRRLVALVPPGKEALKDLYR